MGELKAVKNFFYPSRSFCKSFIADQAAKALVWELSGCGSFANLIVISPKRHLTWISCVLRLTAGSEITLTLTLVGFTVKASVAATFISRGNCFAASSA